MLSCLTREPSEWRALSFSLYGFFLIKSKIIQHWIISFSSIGITIKIYYKAGTNPADRNFLFLLSFLLMIHSKQWMKTLQLGKQYHSIVQVSLIRCIHKTFDVHVTNLHIKLLRMVDGRFKRKSPYTIAKTNPKTKTLHITGSPLITCLFIK